MNSFKIHRELPLLRDIELHIKAQTLCAILYGLHETYGEDDSDYQFFAGVYKEIYGSDFGSQDD